MKNQATIDIDDSCYVRSHMKSPRGYGSWAFVIGDSHIPVVFTPSMTYSDAKVWIKAHVRDLIASGVIPASVAYVSVHTQP